MKSEDRKAAAALARVDATARSQLRVLAALRDLVEACPDDGVVGSLVAAFLQDRQAAFVRFHERTLGDPVLDDDARAAAFDEAIAFTDGVAGDAAALRERRAEVVAGVGGTGGRPAADVEERAAVPFFARFLEDQR